MTLARIFTIFFREGLFTGASQSTLESHIRIRQLKPGFDIKCDIQVGHSSSTSTNPPNPLLPHLLPPFHPRQLDPTHLRRPGAEGLWLRPEV
jgi:hypothetical protein